MDRFQHSRQPDWDWWGRLWPAPGETLRQLGATPGDAVAEIGSGNGYFALPAAGVVDPGTVYALDLDATLLAELEAIAALQDVENVHTIHGDARELATLLPGPVDVCLIANTFHGIEDRESVASQVAEALSPDGRFVVVNWYDRPRAETTVASEPRGPPTELRLSPAETTACVESAAPLERTRQLDLPPYHYALVFEPEGDDP